MRGRQQWMTLGIMQDDQFAAAQDLSTQLAHRSAWDEHITVDRLAMPVHVEDGGSSGLIRKRLFHLPQLPGPLGHHCGQAFGCSRMCQAGEKPLRVALTV